MTVQLLKGSHHQHSWPKIAGFKKSNILEVTQRYCTIMTFALSPSGNLSSISTILCTLNYKPLPRFAPLLTSYKYTAATSGRYWLYIHMILVYNTLIIAFSIIWRINSSSFYAHVSILSFQPRHTLNYSEQGGIVITHAFWDTLPFPPSSNTTYMPKPWRIILYDRQE